MRSRIVCVASLLLTLMASAQQKPPIPSIGETIEVSLVNLDVFVTDRTGQRVHALTKDDFEILENGVRQPITNFAEYTHESTLTLQTPAAPVALRSPGRSERSSSSSSASPFRLSAPIRSSLRSRSCC